MSPTELQEIIGPIDDIRQPTLENRVAFQWAASGNVLGYQHGVHRDRTVLDWMDRALRSAPAPRAALDVGSAFGNYTFMLNARMGRDQSIAFEGIDLSESQVHFANTFAQQVPGYGNCRFTVADIEGELPFEDGSFDVINLSDVLEHLEHPVDTLARLRRMTKPGGSIVISTPQRTTLFKRLAHLANRSTRGGLFRRYYIGKQTELDDDGQPVMEVDAGHDHISEMNLDELVAAGRRAGLRVAEVELMSVMSGSEWFDEHAFLLAGLMTLEAVHRVLKRPSWAHAVVVRFVADGPAGLSPEG